MKTQKLKKKYKFLPFSPPDLLGWAQTAAGLALPAPHEILPCCCKAASVMREENRKVFFSLFIERFGVFFH